MDAFLLTFTNPVLEKEYARHRTGQLLKADSWMFVSWFFVRTVIMWHASGTQHFVWSWGRSCAFGIFWLLPLFEGFFRRLVKESWFLQHGTTVHSLQGALQSFVAMWVTSSMLSASAENNSMISELTMASGAVIQIFNLWWYPMSFKFHISLSSWTVAVWIAFVMPVCTSLLDSMGYAPMADAIACNLNMMFDGLLFCTDGACVEASSGSGRKLFIFWHVYMFLVMIPCWVWFHERASRVEFLERLDEGEVETEIPVVQRNGSFLEFVSPILLALPVVWRITSVVCSVFWSMDAT